jgi:pyruvate kinase
MPGPARVAAPKSSDPALLEQMIRAGVNVVRLNFSHGKAQDHIDRATLVREAAQRAGREVAIMADLQGPKIRVGKFAEGKVMLEPGMKFVLDAFAHRAGRHQGRGPGLQGAAARREGPATPCCSTTA